VQRVGAAFCHYVDVAAQSAAEFRLASRSDHLKLVNYIESVEDAAEPCGIIVADRRPR
jgi:hypothetical protein